MRRERVTIANRLGLHARPAMTFVERASCFAAEVTVRRTDSEEAVDGKSIMQMLMLAGTCGTEVEIAAEGVDEGDAVAALAELVRSGFGEEE